MALPYKEFVHPVDKAALEAMRAVPGFDAIMKKLSELLEEKSLFLTAEASLIRLGEKQYPNLYARLAKVCDRLQIDVPTLYLTSQGDEDCHVIGDTKIALVLSTNVFWTFTEEEIETIFAVACGHIVCHHTLYLMLADTLVEGFLGGFDFFIVKAAAAGLNAAIQYWKKVSKFSADRVAAYYHKNTEPVTDYHFKSAGCRSYIPGEHSKREFIQQGSNYKELLNASLANKLLLLLNPYQVKDPLLAARANAIEEWWATFKLEEFEQIQFAQNIKLITEGSKQKHNFELSFRNAEVSGFKGIASKVRTFVNNDKLRVVLNGVTVEIAPKYKWKKVLNHGVYHFVLRTHNVRAEYDLYLTGDTRMVVEWNDLENTINVREEEIVSEEKPSEVTNAKSKEIEDKNN